MEISNELRAFLNSGEVKAALVRDDFERVYDLWAHTSVDFTLDTKNLTELLYAADIDPLLYMSKVPWYFLYRYAGKLDSFTVPPNIAKIERSAFFQTKLEAIEISSSVTFIGAFAFTGCDNLRTVNIPKGCRIDIEAFAGTSIQELVLEDVDFRGVSTFSRCDSLQSVIMKGNTPTLKKSTFKDCANLVHVELPTSLQRVESAAFLRCIKLKEVNYNGTIDQWKDIYIDSRNEKLFRCKILCADGSMEYNPDEFKWVEI